VFEQLKSLGLQTEVILHPGILTFRLFQSCSHIGATDPRDRIYSLLGLPRIEGLAIVPDYQKSIEEVYCDFAHALLEKEDGIFFLMFCGSGLIRTTEEGGPFVHHLFLPSWVPNWDVISVINTNLICRLDWQADGNAYRASKKVEIDGRTLKAYGLSIF